MTKHLIIAEGPRGAGKSTYARMLRDKTPSSTLINFTGFPDTGKVGLDKIVAYYQNWMSLLRGMYRSMDDYTIICDRFFMSEQVYSVLYKDYTFRTYYESFLQTLPRIADKVTYLDFQVRAREELELRLQRDKVPFFTAKETVTESLKQQDEYSKVARDMQILADSYPAFIRYVPIDTTGQTQEDVKNTVLWEVT